MTKHRQWDIYDINHYDHYISLNEDTLQKIKEWCLIKSKIVYSSNNLNEKKNLIQRELRICMLEESERRNILNEVKIINTPEYVWLKISQRLLELLVETNVNDYEYRYNWRWDKIHFYIKDNWDLYENNKLDFDYAFQQLEELNMKFPITGDLFEDEYKSIHIK